MQEMARKELDEANESVKELQSLLLKSLLPKDDADERDCILEVRAGKRFIFSLSPWEMHIYIFCAVPFFLLYFLYLLPFCSLFLVWCSTSLGPPKVRFMGTLLPLTAREAVGSL